MQPHPPSSSCLLVLLKAQLQEPLLGILAVFGPQPALTSPKPALRWAKPGTQAPTPALKQMKKINLGT